MGGKTTISPESCSPFTFQKAAMVIPRVEPQKTNRKMKEIAWIRKRTGAKELASLNKKGHLHEELASPNKKGHLRMEIALHV